jgi:hypothetical protein
MFNLVTRNRSRFSGHELFFRKNVNILDYNDDITKDIPCFYCISENEKQIIAESGKKDVDRLMILKSNMKIADSMLSVIEKLSPSILFIITNPVEIISTFFKNKIPSIKVYGL